MAAPLSIDVYLDLICPWCLIGKRFLDEALLQFRLTAPDSTVEVRWHSVQLLPDAPVDGWDFNRFYLKRLGTAENMRQRQAQVNAAAGRAGFQIDFSRIPFMPNTQQAHQLLNFASTRLHVEDFSVLLERLFAAHFWNSKNLGECATLLGIAQDMGLSPVTLQACLDRGVGKPVARDVPGVPFFVFNRQLAMSGAQPPDVLLDAMWRVSAAVQNEPAL
jgi:predicted DsbA family dithiol-disulfide isomerase